MELRLSSCSLNLRCSRLRCLSIALNIEDFESLKLEIAVEHGYEMLSRGHQYIIGSFMDGGRRGGV
ncbi:MAG: hypothetical protein MUO26_00450 [Methanotrichaceae archaeon]|nr:hypothetical protein [Methanotrichaceae archaeon]